MKKIRLSPLTLKLIKKRKHWRQRAISAAVDFAIYPAGKPDREDAERQVTYTLGKIRQWFRTDRADRVVNAIQRRAVNAFRAQYREPS